MMIHLDSDNPKSIEQKVHELILKKLYIKVNDEKIFINKEDFISLILKDIIALAKADFDIEKAVEIALKEQKEYQAIPDTKKNELEEASIEFQVEVDAYQAYLNDLESDIPYDEIYTDVLSILNSETEFLEKKLHGIMMEALSLKLSDVDAESMGMDREKLLDNFANQVKLIASYDNIDESVEAAYDEFENYPKKHLVTKESIKNEFERFAPLAEEEINAYKMALSLDAQNAEFPIILNMVKQILKIQ